MYGCESWTTKKAEHGRIDAFELWCWRRCLRVPWTARRSNQSILKEISPGCSLDDVEAETPILWPPDAKGWLIWKDPWCWERSRTGGEGDDRGWDGWMASPTQWTWVWVNSRGWWWTGRPGMLQFMGSQSQTRLSDWTELNQTSWKRLVMYMLYFSTMYLFCGITQSTETLGTIETESFEEYLIV